MITTLNQASSVKVSKTLVCAVCGESGEPVESRMVRCNVRQYRHQHFLVERCRHCGSLQTERVKNLAEYYTNYPIRNQRLDYFSRVWYGVILKRLVAAGLKKEHTLLDYGCNQGLFLQYLKTRGYGRVSGFDSYVDRFQDVSVLQRQYDWVIAMDVIEHDEQPKQMTQRLMNLCSPSGRLCLTSPNADGIHLSDPKSHLMELHVPYHVHIPSSQGVMALFKEGGRELLAYYPHSYLDSWWPGTSRVLFESLIAYGGNDIDVAFEPPRIYLFFRHPSLVLKFFFGYFLYSKKKDHMMLIFGSVPSRPDNNGSH
jgi:SAM-dependent methyltransferase